MKLVFSVEYENTHEQKFGNKFKSVQQPVCSKHTWKKKSGYNRLGI